MCLMQLLCLQEDAQLEMSATTAAEQPLAEEQRQAEAAARKARSSGKWPGRLLLFQQLKLASHSCVPLQQQQHVQLIWLSAPFAAPEADESLEMLCV